MSLMMIARILAALVVLLPFISSAAGQATADLPAVPATPADKPGTYQRMDYGPVIAHTVVSQSGKQVVAQKGLAVRLQSKNEKGETIDHAVIYDTDTLGVVAVTTGGWLDLTKTNHTSYKGSGDAALEGTTLFSIAPGSAGWANPKDGKFDPRGANHHLAKATNAVGQPVGPLPKDWAHYKGYYRIGDQVVLKYTVGDCEILETPRWSVEGDALALVRYFEVRVPAAKTRDSLWVAIDDLPANADPRVKQERSVTLRRNGRLTMVSAVGRSALHVKDRQLVMEIKTSPEDRETTVLAAAVMCVADRGEQDDAKAAIAFAMSQEKRSGALGRYRIPSVDRGGPARWAQPVDTMSKLAPALARESYVVDSLPCPEKNPWESWFRPTGFDFFADGKRAAICTWNGDVWIVSGIDAGAREGEHLTWKRFASGLYEPLGLVIREEKVFVVGYDQITRLHDLNGDGEADYYENFNNDAPALGRCYCLCLSQDAMGNLYTIRNANRSPDNYPLHGCLYRVSADGSKLEIIATGLRSANGLAIGPNGEIAAADQEGNWTPASRIDLLQQGDFVGFRSHAHRELPAVAEGGKAGGKTGAKDVAPLPGPEAVLAAGAKPPLCWIPKTVDNSAGDLIFVPNDPQQRFGPLGGMLLGTSYGMCKLYLVPFEKMDEPGIPNVGSEIRSPKSPIVQGGVVPLPLNFTSGIMRLRFNPRDGQLYALGLKGWQTRAAFDSGFFRVRYTGKPACLPVAVHPTKAGVTLTFTDALDRATAEDTGSYQVLRWNYLYSKGYGSPEFSVADPSKQGRDTMKVTRASLAKDGRTLTLAVDDMKPVMQMLVKVHLESEKGNAVKHEIYHTVHRLSER